MLIQEFRIKRAGVICPLTEQNIELRFGTRHRAAIGSTEETDALAIVVSEERGEVRLVHRGQLSEPLRIADLEQRIVEWLAEPRVEATRSPGQSMADMSRADLSHVDLDRSALRSMAEPAVPPSSATGRPPRAEAKKA